MQQNSQTSMSQEEARKRLEKSGYLLLLDSPESMEIGFDNMSWKIGEKFRGIKMIPYGAHLVFFAQKSENYMFKNGFFVHFSETERVVIRKWSPQLEDFIALEDREEEGRYRDGVLRYDFDTNLGPYPLDRHDQWLEVSSYITKDLIDKVSEIKDQIKETQEKKLEKEFVIDLDSDQEDHEQNDEHESSEQTQEKQKKDEQPTALGSEEASKDDIKQLQKTLSYSLIEVRRYQHNLRGEELTRLNLDLSHTLSEIIRKEFNNDYKKLLGELQLSFTYFLLVEHLESFEHWKNLIHILTNSIQALKNEFFVEFIPVIYGMLRQFPQDFFIDIISKDSFLRKDLTHFITNCKQSGNKLLISRAKKLEKLLSEHFLIFPKEEQTPKVIQVSSNKYQFEEPDDDENPVIVDLDQQYYY